MELETARAKERMSEGGGDQRSANRVASLDATRSKAPVVGKKAAAEVGKEIGISGSTVERMQRITNVEQGRTEDPEEVVQYVREVIVPRSGL